MKSIADALIALKPNSEWVLPPDNDYSGIQWIKLDGTAPTQEQVDAKVVELNAQEPLDNCKQKASDLLYETDWTTIPDVANPANTPYLTNQAEFIAWRSQIRALAINPVADPVFPPAPQPVWG